MPKLIISTDNMRFYYAVANYFKEEGLSFMSMRLGEPLPVRDTVVITTEKEAVLIEHPRVYYHDDPMLAARMAIQALKMEKRYEKIVIGIDPGKAIGMAVVGDGRVLSASVLSAPEDVPEELAFYLNSYTAERFLIRIGDGDRTVRDRIIAGIWPFGLEMEMVKEQDVKKEGRRAGEFARTRRGASDMAAAIGISMKEGARISEQPEVWPSDGEIREIQRRSRIRSGSSITISKELARRVAKGEIGMDEAIEEQKGE